MKSEQTGRAQNAEGYPGEDSGASAQQNHRGPASERFSWPFFLAQILHRKSFKTLFQSLLGELGIRTLWGPVAKEEKPTSSLLRNYFKTTSRLLKNYFNITSSLLQDYFKLTSRLLQDYFKLTSSLLQDSFKLTSRLSQDFFRTTSRLLQAYFTLTSRSLQDCFKTT